LALLAWPGTRGLDNPLIMRSRFLGGEYGLQYHGYWFMVTRIYGYKDIWLQGYIVTWIYGFKDIWFMVSWIYGYLDIKLMIIRIDS
jgi:hypothetical protein